MNEKKADFRQTVDPTLEQKSRNSAIVRKKERAELGKKSLLGVYIDRWPQISASIAPRLLKLVLIVARRT